MQLLGKERQLPLLEGSYGQERTALSSAVGLLICRFLA